MATALEAKDARIEELESELKLRDERITALERQVSMLLEQVAALTEKLNQNSCNSHLPPSSDPPGSRTKVTKKKSKNKRKRGGQRGHRGSRRELLPTDKVDKFVDLFPPNCENCWKPLPETPDPLAKRYQTTELPPITPHTTEVRRHSVKCVCCGHKTHAAYDENIIPASPFGPRLMALVALLTGVYHLSRRKTVDLLSDVVGVRISLGGVSAIEARVSTAVEPAVDEAWQQVQRATVKHTDGTSWLQSGVSLSLWTIATTMATVFKIVTDGSKKTLRPLYGSLRGILVSDRAKALNFWAMERRQVCWAHLLRKFIAFSERDGPGGVFGRELLDYTGIMFEYWRDYKSGNLSKERFRAWMAPLQQQLEATLERAAAAGIARLSGSCRDMLEHKDALWTFVECAGVEPTNNHAERELRAFVLWRKRSFGTQSDRGNLFAERLMTVAQTTRKQKKNALSFLSECCEAKAANAVAPSMFALPPMSHRCLPPMSHPFRSILPPMSHPFRKRRSFVGDAF